MTEDQNTPQKGERIAKMLARAGVGSRRAVERMIAAGMVKIGDQVITTPATLITSVDGITVDGMVVKPPAPTTLWKYHKPAGRVTTYCDEQGRPTVFEAMPTNMPRVLSVGRLDLTTEGLLLMTNDGELARWLELPSTGWLRTYKVRCYGYFDRQKLTEIKRGITLDGVSYRGVKIDIDESREKSNIWLTIGIVEGKNREVRKLLDYIGLQVTRLIRLSFGPFQLEQMKRGDIRQVSAHDMRQLCADFFKNRETVDDSPPAEDTAVTKSRTGWAKAKPKPNQRRLNKKKKFRRQDTGDTSVSGDTRDTRDNGKKSRIIKKTPDKK